VHGAPARDDAYGAPAHVVEAPAHVMDEACLPRHLPRPRQDSHAADCLEAGQVDRSQGADHHARGRLPELIITPAAKTEDDVLWTDSSVVAKLEQLDASTRVALAKLHERDLKSASFKDSGLLPTDPDASGSALVDGTRLDQLATKLRLLDTPAVSSSEIANHRASQIGNRAFESDDHHLHELELQLAELDTSSASCWRDYKASHPGVSNRLAQAQSHAYPTVTPESSFSRSSSNDMLRQDILGNPIDTNKSPHFCLPCFLSVVSPSSPLTLCGH
jgi:hypothetical protein